MTAVAGLITVPFILSGAAPPSGGGSQTPAIVALALAAISGMATLWSIWRQNRQDRVANTAVHSTAANEATKQSFEQMMATVKYQASQIAELQQHIQEQNIKIEQLQDQVDQMEGEAARTLRESNRLRSLVIQLGGQP